MTLLFALTAFLCLSGPASFPESSAAPAAPAWQDAAIPDTPGPSALGEDLEQALPEGFGESPDLTDEERARLEGVQRLLAIYRRMPGLRDVRITLSGGILEIWGTAISADVREAAVERAREVVPDVAFVDASALVVETDPRRRLEPVVDRIQEKGLAFLRFVPTLILGFLILVLGALAAAWLSNRKFLFDRVARNPFARNLLRQAVRTVVFLTALLLALDLMGVTALVGAVLGAAGVAGIAIGFAFRDIVENYLAGILLSLRQPFAPHDHVQIAGEEGRVARLTGRETVLMTLDGNHVRIPNATVFKSVITNMTRNPRRRFLFDIGIAPSERVGRAIATARDAVAGVPGILEHPPVAVRLQELQDSATALRISGWVDQTQSDFGKVRSRSLRAVKEAFEDAGIETPPPEFGIRILGNSHEDAFRAGTPERPAGRPADPGAVRPAGEAAACAGDPARDLEPDPNADISPDTTIEEEIAREHLESDEEDLLQPPPGRS
ncbi:MAG: mechanosensitive ion channel family protein [Gemmatimonadales bacterium]|nr:MAG: mechanosensitive ion channel family protein [Gemmatimonadales bacterium]